MTAPAAPKGKAKAGKPAVARKPAAPKEAPAKAKAKAAAKKPAKALAKKAKAPKVAPPPEMPAAAPVPAAPAVAVPAPAEPTAPPAPPAPSFAPPASDEIPFEALSRDAASAFLYAALLPEETLGFVKQLGLGRPGFRPEGLGEVERCDLLADELIAHAPSRAPVLAALRKALKEPAFARSTLDEAAADELLEVAGTDHGLAIAMWRLLVDPLPAVRARGAAALERLAAEWYGPAPEGAEEGPAPQAGRGGGGGGGEEAARRAKALEEKLARAEARAEEARLRGEAQRDKLQVQLKEARAEAARAVDEAARARAAAEVARTAQRAAEAALSAARASDAATEVVRLRAALREAEVRLHAAEAAAAKAGERAAGLEAALQEASAAGPGAGGEAGEGGAAARQPEADEPEEAPATWLLPVFTPEFYASLQGWDRRIQRAALKQAFLLSQDWRHPSLRALALEGLPGYYRVRVATDVRLIYRRGERQDAVELCSLIDREDLDRYVRQAKTR